MYCYNADNPLQVEFCPVRFAGSPAAAGGRHLLQKRVHYFARRRFPRRNPPYIKHWEARNRLQGQCPETFANKLGIHFQIFLHANIRNCVFFFFLSRYPAMSFQCPLIRTTIHLVGKVSMMECNKDSFQLRWVLVLFFFFWGAPSCPFLTYFGEDIACKN